MKLHKNTQFARFVLLSNGVADLFAAVALFFPEFDIPLPGYENYTPGLKFVAGGWGIAALTFGVGRIWTSTKPGFHRVMLSLGLIEASMLTVFCLLSILFVGITWLQAMFPLLIGGTWGILYLLALTRLGKIKE